MQSTQQHYPSGQIARDLTACMDSMLTVYLGRLKTTPLAQIENQVYEIATHLETIAPKPQANQVARGERFPMLRVSCSRASERQACAAS